MSYKSLNLAVALMALSPGLKKMQAGEPTWPTLEAGFHSPPAAARPRVWWHWMNGNVAKEGVKLDLEWMKRVGIGGVQNFDASFDWGTPFDTPREVPQPLEYLTPQWREALRYSVGLAQELGLEFAISASPGWSETGGPWVQPQEAMKKLVWSETQVTGGAPFRGYLARPPETAGLFQNIPLVEFNVHAAASSRPAYYVDVATIAYRVPASEQALADLEPAVTSSSGIVDAARLRDGDLAQAIPLPFLEGRRAWIQFSYPVPQRIQAMTAVIGLPLGVNPMMELRENGWLEASDDGQTFRKVIELPRSGAPQQTVTFAPTVARMFRVVLERPAPNFVEQIGVVPPPIAHQIAELVLHAVPRVNRFEDKAGFSARQILGEDDTPAVAVGDAVRESDIVDLTSRMRADGSLDWTVPAGQWTVLRLGYSLVGRKNNGPSRAGLGLEVDKLNSRHVNAYLERYLGEYEKTLGAQQLMGRRGLRYVLTDSYEAGAQNWTDDLPEQFSKRRGYEMRPWLPVLTGRVVESAAASDRFLWDFRKTLGELIAEAHYAQISAALRRRGMGRYGESHEHFRAFIGDGMEAKKTADIPMGAMWVAAPPEFTPESSDMDIRESASVAHIYGKDFVAAESFTALSNFYGFAPQELKPVADRMMAMGINRFVIHASVHQHDDKPGPGIGLGPIGQWFTRKETWAEQAGGWIGYLSRSSYLLQQGRFVADIAYLYGEDANVTSLFHKNGPAVVAGYDFDFINADAVLNELSVRDGQLVTRAGMRYRVLALDASTRRMSLPVLRKIRDLVRAGAVVVGAKPGATPSLADDEQEFQTLVAELWSEGHGESGVRAGRVIADRPLAEVLAVLQIAPDVTFTKSNDRAPRFLHRTLEDGELYFLAHDASRPQNIEVSFRVSGRRPELWRADTGAITPLSHRMENGRTLVPLQFEVNDAFFVVFREPATAQSALVREPVIEAKTTVRGPWQVSFPPDRGAPTQARFDTLDSWTNNADPGVKYFSGTARYSKTLHIRGDWLKAGSRVQLDLGQVKNLAEVRVNGRTAGLLWKPPFALDITEALKPGDNDLQIEVTNLWPNRLIGDKQPGARRIAFATFDPFKADSPLLPSGLLGPVTLLKVTAP